MAGGEWKTQIPRVARDAHFDATAVDWMPAASEPAAGSVRQKAPRISPEREAFEVTLFLLRGAVGQEGELDGRVGDAECGGHGGVNFGDFFEHEDVGDGVESWATPFFGHEHAAATEGAEFLDGVEGEMVGALPVFDVRTDFGVHELADGVADEELVVGKGEVHFRDGSTSGREEKWRVARRRPAKAARPYRTIRVSGWIVGEVESKPVPGRYK